MAETTESKSSTKKKTISKPIKTAKKSKSSETNITKIWVGILFIMLSFLVGYLGGTVASDNNSSLVDTSNNTQLILSQSEAIAKVAEDVSPSVVSITVQSSSTTDSFFFGPQTRQSESAGTGIILTEDGLIVTNKHVIPNNTTGLSIVLNDGTAYDDIEILGRDPFNDIAFIQINDVKDLVPAKLGNSADLKVGDAVIAIGNALGRFENTVTSGIVSGLGRPIVASDAAGSDSDSLQNLLQTDAAINPGNSGGPLVNINGEVIGINTAVAGNAENIGFAIPIDDAKPGIASVEKNGELIRPYLGVRYAMLTEDIATELGLSVSEGAVITADAGESATLPNSPARKAGLQENDVILKVNEVEINRDNHLVTVVSRYQVDEKITLTILRDETEQQIEVTLEAVPDTL